MFDQCIMGRTSDQRPVNGVVLVSTCDMVQQSEGGFSGEKYTQMILVHNLIIISQNQKLFVIS